LVNLSWCIVLRCELRSARRALDQDPRGKESGANRRPEGAKRNVLLGSQYGGDDRQFFKLPDLRNAVPGGPDSGLHYIICLLGQYPARD
jgi:hypothetical protein